MNNLVSWKINFGDGDVGDIVILMIFSILNLLPTSPTYHQQISSPTSVTNIDVTHFGFFHSNPTKYFRVGASNYSKIKIGRD